MLAASSSPAAAAAPDFQLIIDPPAQQLPPGDSVSFVVGIAAVDGFSEPVTLSVSELPVGVTGIFSVNPILPSGTSVLTLTAESDSPTGTFSFTVTGTGGGITAVASRQVTVDFGLIPICYGAVEGTVTDADTGLPLPGVDVGVGAGTTTDAAGHYRVEGLGLGQNNSPYEHFLLARKAPDYWYFFKHFFAICDQTTRLDFTMVRVKPARVSGQVVEGNPDPTNFDTVISTLTPIDGAKVVVPLELHQNRPVGSSPDPDTTGADGLYDITFPLGYNNEPLNRDVCAYTEGDPNGPAPWREGFWPRCISLGQPEGDEHVVQEIGLVEKCTGSVSGQVLDADTGLPVAGAVVTAIEPQPYLYLVLPGSVQVQADAEGRFSFPELLLGHNNRPRDVIVGADHPGYWSGGTGYTTTRFESCGDHREVTLYPDPMDPPKLGAIEGRVFDEETGAPVEGVEVSLLGGCPCDATDADGYYRLAPVNLGTVDELTGLVFTHRSEYWDGVASGLVRAGETATIDIRILRVRFARITGVVRDAVTKAPIARASVSDGFVGAFTDEEGRYGLEDVSLGYRNAPRDASVRVSADGYWARDVPVPVRADETSTQDFELVPICEDATIVGKVVNALTQEPIPDAVVGGGGVQTRTDANGDYRLEHVRVGVDNSPIQVDLTASHPDFYTQTKRITVFCGAVITVDFGRPPSTAAVEGYVTNLTTNTPIAGVFVGSEFGAADETDENGYYRLPNAPLHADGSDRTWRITAAPEGFESQTKPVTVHANMTARLDFGFGNPPAPGTIVIRKQTQPAGSSQSFAFTTSYGPGFSLSDGQSNTSGPLAAGSYSVGETTAAGWDASASCNDGSQPSNINLSAGETVTCTFENTQRGKIIVVKQTDPDGSTKSFDFTASYDADGFSLKDGESNDSGLLVPGSYSVNETVPAGWDLTSATCSDGSDPATISLGAGTTVTCTFSNRQDGKIILVKQTNPDGSSQSFEFDPSYGPNFNLTDGQSNDSGNLDPGTYSVAEVNIPSGWDLVGKSCDDGSLVTAIGLGAGETVTCTFTNRQRGKAKVIKTVSGAPPSGTQAFTFQLRQGATQVANGTIRETQVANAANGGVIQFTTQLVPGTTYQMCEIVMPGWLTSLGDFVPDSFMPPDGVAPNPNVDNSILCVDFTVAAGETKTFTVDNTPPPGGRALTIGFWKNWSSCSGGKQKPVLDQTLASFPIAPGQTTHGVLIGDLYVDTCQEAVRILNKSTVNNGTKKASDPAFNLAAQLLAAKLNVQAGAGVCPAATTAINQAQALLDQLNFNGITHGAISSSMATTLNNLATTLDNYNNNNLC